MERRAIPASLSYAVALTLALFLASGSAVQAQTWVLKGPAPANGGQPENIPNSPIGGALEAVLAHPTNASILWVGSVNGGIFKTTNATAASPTWTAQTDTQASLSISALERDPNDGTHNTLVAGIGRTSNFASTGGAYKGVLRTTNGGTVWTQLASAGVSDKEIRGLAARGATILAAVTGPIATCTGLGIYRSTNTGASFTQISNVGGTGMPCGFSWDLASDPTDSTRFFAPATGLGAPTNGLYVSTNTGANWAQVGAGSVMDTALEANPFEVQVAVGKAGGANANIFVAVCQSSMLSGLFHSANAGTTWSSLDLPMTTEAVGPMAYGIHPGGQCTPNLSLVADPTDHSVVYIGGDRQPANNEANDQVSFQFPNSIGASTYGGRLFKVDADLATGSQSKPITNCDSTPGPLPSGCSSAATTNDTAPHADSREMVFDANGDLIQTDDGGVYRHTNPSGTTGDWVSVIGNLSAVEQHDINYDTISNILISGNQDNGTTSQTTPASMVWETWFGGDGGDVVVAHNRPVAGQSTRYFSSQNLGGLVRVVFDATNSLVSFVSPALTPLGGSPAVDPQFKTPLKVNDNDPTRLIVGADNGVYESLDELGSVTRLSTDVVTSFRGGGPIAYGRPGNSELLYFGATAFFNPNPPFQLVAAVGRRIGAPGSALAYTLFDNDGQGITGVAIDPDSDTQAFATDTTHVYRTINAGTGWTDVTGNLFTLPNTAGQINFVEYINSGGDRLVVGTDTGVYSATEASGFSTWTLLGTGLPNAIVFELDYDVADNVLAAGTMGRGTWLLDLSGGGCPVNLTLANQTLSTPQTYYASGTITLGPNLTVSGTGVHMVAQEIVFGVNTTISNVFSASIGPCP